LCFQRSRNAAFFLLIAAFALMVTALTHQFRGWLATLMVNQRRANDYQRCHAGVRSIMQTEHHRFTSGRWRSRPRQPDAEVSSENKN
jgi:hypothetical protein